MKPKLTDAIIAKGVSLAQATTKPGFTQNDREWEAWCLEHGETALRELAALRSAALQLQDAAHQALTDHKLQPKTSLALKQALGRINPILETINR
jgi:hypothetical protein